MKKLFLSLVVSLLLFACAEDIQDQRDGGAMQVYLDGVLFQAKNTRAVINDDGSYTIQGLNQVEVLKILLPGASQGVYDLGGSSTSAATFTTSLGATYFTNPNGSGSVSVSNFNTELQELTGTFSFDAVTEFQDTIRARNGVFYEVPILAIEIEPIMEDPIGVPVTDCNTGTFVANIDGDNLQQNNNLCVMAAEFEGQIVITASDPDDKIELRIPVEVEDGDNFELPATGFDFFYTDLTTGTTEGPTEGEVFIFEHNTFSNILRGSFVFRTENHLINLGGFNVTYE